MTDGGVSEWKGSQRVEGDHQWLQQLQDDGEHTRGSVLSDDHATLLSSLTPPRMSSPPPCSDRCFQALECGGLLFVNLPALGWGRFNLFQERATRGGRNESNLEHGQQQGAAWGKGLAQEKQSSIEQHTGVAWCGRQSGRAAKRQTEERGSKPWSALCIGGMGTAFLFLVQDKSEDAAAVLAILPPLTSSTQKGRGCDNCRMVASTLAVVVAPAVAASTAIAVVCSCSNGGVIAVYPMLPCSLYMFAV
ncbi:unnamed protein product [Closterium sp. NIES-65]|nr:unnamed protein product [Closterium sp. NIES-65]